jgi:hypothetical protein
LSQVAKQGENQDATLSAIYNDTHNVAQQLPTLIQSVGDTATALTTINEILGEL